MLIFLKKESFIHFIQLSTDVPGTVLSDEVEQIRYSLDCSNLQIEEETHT